MPKKFFYFNGMSQNLSLSETLPFHAPSRFAVPSEVPGLAARRIAADILDGVLHKQRTLDDQLDGAGAHPGLKSLADRDRALMRRLVATILRRLGTLGHLLSRLLDRGIPTDAPRAQSALLIGAAQILWMDVPDHAAVDLSVRLVQSDRRAAKYAGLVNAVLRRCAREGQPLIDEVKAQSLDIPPWLLTRWIGAMARAPRAIWRRDRPRALARHHRESRRAALGDPPARRDPADRNRAHPAAGFGDDAARIYRRSVVGAGRRRRAAGAVVRRCHRQDHRRPLRRAGRQDRSTGASRCARHRGRSIAGADGAAARQSSRLSLQADDVVADAAEWPVGGDGGYDGVLVDAPCTSTGTIRRHPDVAWLRQECEIAALTALQQRLLQKAVALLKPGGTLVYCTCSLEPEEGEQAVAALLATESASGARRSMQREVAGLTRS